MIDRFKCGQGFEKDTEDSVLSEDSLNRIAGGLTNDDIQAESTGFRVEIDGVQAGRFASAATPQDRRPFLWWEKDLATLR